MEGWSSLSDEMRSKFLKYEATLPGEDRNVPRLRRRRRPQGVQRPLEPRGWISWANFVLEEMQETRFPETEAESFIVSQMEHVGSIYGIARAPEGYRQVIGAIRDRNAKHIIAERVLTKCLERTKLEVWELIKRQIERDGVGLLQSILNSDSVLDAVLGFQSSKKVLSENAET
jgi:hypothetical protein